MAAALLVFSSERVQQEVGNILRVRWRKSGQPTSTRYVGGYVVKKWVMPQRERSVWSVCIRDQLTLEEPARKLARVFRGAILLFPFTAGALVLAPPDVPNAYGVQDLPMLERHLRMHLSDMQRDELCALLFSGPYRPLRMRDMQPPTPGQAEAVYADRFVEALREGRSMPIFDADLFSATGGIYMLSAAVERPPIDERAPCVRGAILAVVRASEPMAASGGSACCICYANRATICLLPCAHQSVCDDCTRSLCGTDSARLACPTCRTTLAGAIRPYL
jgi:hypothetical protein